MSSFDMAPVVQGKWIKEEISYDANQWKIAWLENGMTKNLNKMQPLEREH